jgi:hypothetical protein
MKFKKAFEVFAAFLETFSVAMTAANFINPVVIFFRCGRLSAMLDEIHQQSIIFI